MEKDTKGMKIDSSVNGQDNMTGAFNGDDWEINIDELLEQADMLVNNDMVPTLPEQEEEGNKPKAGKEVVAEAKSETTAKSEAEVKSETEAKPEAATKPETAQKSSSAPASDPNSEIDADLDEINSLLEQANLNEKIDDDMLALLESATENQEDEDNPDEVFDMLEDGEPMEDMKISGVPEQEEEEGEEGKKKKFGRKRKKKKEKKTKKDANKESKSEKGEKKPGFLAKIIALLGQGEDFEEEKVDTPVDENLKMLNGADDKKAAKASKKGNKKKEKNKEEKGGKKAKPKEKAKAKEKPQKPEKAKKKKEKPIAGPEEKSVKILNGKSFAAIAGLCLSIIAGVMIVTTFIPEHADKQAARKAFQERDYETVYKLFYNKKLSSEEELLFNQSKVIRQMERRLEAYQNNITLGRELEAVDSLMRGVESYQNLWEADQYQVRYEVDNLYLQMCGILENNYGISQEEAVIIATSDKIAYTKALYALVDGTELNFMDENVSVSNEGSIPSKEAGGDTATESGEEQTEDGVSLENVYSEDNSSEDTLPEDMLPEEEDILN